VTREEPLGLSRRDFVKGCLTAAAAVGLSGRAAAQVVDAAASGVRPSVIWIPAQACGGCGSSLLHAVDPVLSDLMLEAVSFEYHPMLSAAAGVDSKGMLDAAIERSRGRYILVVEGAIPRNGRYCTDGGRPVADVVRTAGASAAAVVALGSCASWGGISASREGRTGAAGISELVSGKPLVRLPGCPPNPAVLLGTMLQYAALGTLPRLDAEKRPVFSYSRTIHELCPRRPAFDAGKFVRAYGDEGHRKGYCLYQLGCKGPSTYASCPAASFNGVAGAWPVGIGHPCIGCASEGVAFKASFTALSRIEHPTPAAGGPQDEDVVGFVSPLATGVAGLIGGILAGAAWFAARKLERVADPDVEPRTPADGEGTKG
jgi:hydrogenase small subunit